VLVVPNPCVDFLYIKVFPSLPCQNNSSILSQHLREIFFPDVMEQIPQMFVRDTMLKYMTKFEVHFMFEQTTFRFHPFKKEISRKHPAVKR
jgi:hypothetical protein